MDFVRVPSSSGADPLDAFVRAQGDRLLRLAYGLTGNTSDAEDLWQDTFADVIRSWEKVVAAGALAAYVRTMMTRRHISNHRRRWRSERPMPNDELDRAHHPQGEAEAARDLWPLLEGLSPRTRAVLVLRYAEDLDDATIAEILGIGASTVRSVASRGLAALRERDMT